VCGRLLEERGCRYVDVDVEEMGIAERREVFEKGGTRWLDGE